MATFTVTNTSDAGAGSLRQAVLDANGTAGFDTILIQDGIGGDVDLHGELEITEGVTINGGGYGVDGNSAGRIFNIATTDLVRLTGIDLAFGSTSGQGGAIFVGVGGQLELTNSSISFSSAADDGGAIWASANSTVTIVNSRLFDNDAGDYGGAIATDLAVLEIRSSSFTNNHADANGGAIFAGNGSATSIVSSTFANNSTDNSGGAVFVTSELSIVSSTLSGNSAAASGGAVYAFNYGGASIVNSTLTANLAPIGAAIAISRTPLEIVNSTIYDNGDGNTAHGGGIAFNVTNFDTEATIINSVIAGNTAADTSSADIAVYSSGPPNGTVYTDAAYNNFFGSVSADFSDYIAHASGNLYAVDEGPALLAPLGNNGGPVQTMAILAGSPLIAAGDVTRLPTDTFDLDSDSDVTELLPLDATGHARSQGGIDIGAVESSFATAIVVDTVSDDETVDRSLAEDRLDGDGLSLREAIHWAGAGETITFDTDAMGGDVIELDRATALVLSRDVEIDGDVDGDGHPDIMISGIGSTRIFTVDNNANVVLRSLYLADGSDGHAGGGAIYTEAGTNLTVINSTLANNYGYRGGAIYLGGSGTIVNSTIIANRAFDSGGIYVGHNQSLRLVNSTVALNASYGTSGGIGTDSFATVTAINSTITGNFSGYGYGHAADLAFGSKLYSYNSVFAGNLLTLYGYSYAVDGYDITGANLTQLVARNSVLGSLYGFDALDLGTGSATSLVDADPMLGITAVPSNFGIFGSVTFVPLDGSPLIDGGDPAYLPDDELDINGDNNVAEPLPIDNRWAPRTVGTSVDIGPTEKLAFADSGAVAEDGNLTATGNALANDFFVDLIPYYTNGPSPFSGDVVLAGETSFGRYGELVVAADGTWTYTLDNELAQRVGAAGSTDVFTYFAVKGMQVGEFSQIIITVAGANDAPIAGDDSNSTDPVVEDQGADQATGNVLANDSDPDDGDTIFVYMARAAREDDSSVSFGLLSQVVPLIGKYGSLTIAADGTYIYTLNDADPDTQALSEGQIAHDYFSYIVRDSASPALNAIGEIDIFVKGNNDEPTAVNDTLAALEDTPITFTAAQLVGNDTDIDANDILSIASVLSGIGGTAVLNSNGTVTFTPTADFIGAATFTYQVTDGTDTDGATVTVNVANVVGNTITGGLLPDLINGSNPVGNPATNEEDLIDGGAGNDTIFALGGDDTVRGGLGKDSMDGGAGRDTLDYSDKTKAVTVTLNGATFVTVKVGANEDTVANFENVIGGSAGDRLTGDGLDNFLSGGARNDILKGGAGIDTLVGGLGADTLTGGLPGGLERDFFLFNVAATTANADKITDMTHDVDIIQLDDAFFAAIGPTLTANEFVSGPKITKALDADDRILYNTKTGVLSYDPDGIGSAKAIKFATLTNKPLLLDHEDFLIV